MSRRTQTLDPNQGELITFLPQSGIEVVADVYATTKPEDGPSVDLLERSRHLGSALTALSSASRLTGLEIASDTPGLRARLESQYDDVDALAGRSYDARHNHLKTAKIAFAHASGHYEMLKSQPENESSIVDSSREMYGEFIKEFADSKGAVNRRKMQQKLIRQQILLSKNRSRGRVE